MAAGSFFLAEVEVLSWVIGHSSWPYRNAICNQLRARKGWIRFHQDVIGQWFVKVGVCGEGRAFSFLKYIYLCGFGVLTMSMKVIKEKIIDLCENL